MPTKNSVIKETETLLETAQKEVLKELNSEDSFFRKLFLGSNKSSYLRDLQSKISKAINKIKTIDRDEDEQLASLQTHLNEKAQTIRDLEIKIEESRRESELLRDKIKAIEFQKDQKPKEDENPSVKESATIEEKYKQKIAELEESYASVLERFKNEQTESNQAKKLSIELSRRLKRLKTEIIAS